MLIVPSDSPFLLNLINNLSWLIELKAPLKSVKSNHGSTISLFSSFIRLALIVWLTLLRLISVPNPYLNPIWVGCKLLLGFFSIKFILESITESMIFRNGGYIVMGRIFRKLIGYFLSFIMYTCLAIVCFTGIYLLPEKMSSQISFRFIAMLVRIWFYSSFMYSSLRVLSVLFNFLLQNCS